MRASIAQIVYWLSLVGVLFFLHSAHAELIDVYRTNNLASDPSVAPLLDGTPCRPAIQDLPLALEDVIVQAICASPQARKAWAASRAQAAAVGISESAYLPTLNATTGVERDTLSTTYTINGFGQLDVPQNSSSRYAILNLSWVLFDFGKRNAQLRQTRELLAAANAAEDDALQTVFFNAAQAYYSLRDAMASVQAARETEAVAQQSLAEATVKHDAGVGTLADQLQAQTTYRRAVLDRVGAEGDERSASGALSTAMGLAANTPVQIAPTDPIPEYQDLTAGVDQLINDAKSRQPKLMIARARLEAARANVDAVRAEGRPTIALVGDVARNNPSYQQEPGELGTSISASHGSTIGIQVTIPIFEGFSSHYKVEQAQAKADELESDLQDVGLQVALDVWKSYQSLKTDNENLHNSAELLTDAKHSLEIAQGRYKAGVGTFTELLSAQTALADAQKQRVQAISKWHASRLKLAASLGDLGLWSIR